MDPAWAGVIVAFLATLAAFYQANLSRRAITVAERQAAVAEAALPPPPPPVGWQIRPAGTTSRGRPKWGLVTIGTEIAEDVELDEARTPQIVRAERQSPPVRPGASIPLLNVASFGQPTVREIWIRWRGQPEWVPVALPPDLV